MGKLKVTERDLRRVTRSPAGPVRRGVSFIGVLGWVLAVVAGAALALLIIGGRQRHQALRAMYQQRYETTRQELDSSYEELAARVNATADRVKELQSRDKEFGEARQLAARLDQLKGQATRAAGELESYERQFALARERLQFPYQTMGELLVEYQRLNRIIDAAAKEEDTRPEMVTVAAPVAEAPREEPAARKPVAKLIDVSIETAKQKSKGLVSCNVGVKNGDFNHDYEITVCMIFYGAGVENKHTLRVLRRVEEPFTLTRRQEKTVFSGRLPIVWKYGKAGSWEFEGVAVIVNDADGDLVTGKTMKTSQMALLGAFAELKEGDLFDASLKRVLTARNQGDAQ